jgi:hypothetical protein
VSGELVAEAVNEDGPLLIVARLADGIPYWPIGAAAALGASPAWGQSRRLR